MKSVVSRRLLAGLPLLALALAGCSTANLAEAPGAISQAQVAGDIALPAQSGLTGWNFPVYDIPADPAVRYGILENGMKYAIMRNATPQGEVVLRFGFDVGWIDETEGNLNAAHFIEHMAFNGSTNVPEGEIVKLLEREGLEFGADTNASTFFEDTTYKLSLPRNDAALIDTGLMLMREIGSELTIDPAAIDRERGILQSEIQTRNSFQARMTRDYFRFIAPGTPFAENFYNPAQAGTTANIGSAQLRELYERYYRPDNATLVIVGDVEPEAVEAMVKARFADWDRPSGAIPESPRGAIDFAREAQAGIFVDPAVPTIVRIDRFAPYEDRRDTIAQARSRLQLQLASIIINQRLQRLARDPDSPILQGGFAIEDFFDRASQSNLTVVAKEGQWDAALATAEQETRRAIQYGFTASELTEAMTNLETGIRNAAEQAATRRSTALADGILATVRDERIFAHPATMLAVFEQLRGDFTADAVHDTLRARFATSQPLIHLSAKTEVVGGADTVLAAYRQSQQIAVTPPAEEALAAFAYEDFGPASAIVLDERVGDPGYRKIRFANNVMLNLKQTDFKDSEVMFHVRVGSGELAFGREEPAAALMMNSMFGVAGLEAHSFDELNRIVAGQVIFAGFGVADGHFHISGSTKPKDFLRQMQVSAAYLTAPGYREQAEGQWRALLPNYIAQLDANPQAVAQNVVPRIVANGDVRFGVPATEELLGITLADLRAAITPNLQQGPVEIAVVGDFDEAAVIEAVGRTFGALAQRPAELASFDEARQVSFAADRSARMLYHAGAADQGLVQVFWPTTDDDDQREEVVGSLAAEALRLRLLETLREELGATYTPGASLNMSSTYDDFGYLSAYAIVQPDKQALVFEAIEEIVGDMRARPISDDLLTRVRNPLIERLNRQRQENGYWLNALEGAQLEPARVERVRQYETLLRAATPADVQAFVRRYLQSGKDLRVAIVPKPAAE